MKEKCGPSASEKGVADLYAAIGAIWSLVFAAACLVLCVVCVYLIKYAVWHYKEARSEAYRVFGVCVVVVGAVVMLDCVVGYVRRVMWGVPWQGWGPLMVRVMGSDKGDEEAR